MVAARNWVGGLALLLGGVALVPRLVAQQTSTADNESSPAARADSGPTLSARLDELEQQIRILQRLRELSADSAAAAAKTRQSATANAKDGFSLKSADGQYTLRLRGYFQADGRFFSGDEAKTVPNSFFLRRARPIMEATVGRYFGFRLMPDFAQGQVSIFDAYWEGNFDPAFSVRAGKFKPPVGFERLQSATDVAFAERGLPTNLAPSRDIGLQVSGDVSTGLLAYQVGVFDGVPDLASGDADLNDSKDLDARVFVQPFRRGALKGLGVGVSGSTGVEQGTATSTGLASYRAPSQQAVFRYRIDPAAPANTVIAEGRRTRLSPHAYLSLGSFGVLGEYILSQQQVRVGSTSAKLKHRAWQASGSYFLTGEKAGYKSPMPKQPFDPGVHTWGAVELVARYGELDLDDDAFPIFANPASSVTKAKALGLGVNWHLTRQIKVAFNYEHTTFDGGAATGDRKAEDFVVTRVQHSF